PVLGQHPGGDNRTDPRFGLLRDPCLRTRTGPRPSGYDRRVILRSRLRLGGNRLCRSGGIGRSHEYSVCFSSLFVSPTDRHAYLFLTESRTTKIWRAMT